MLSKNKSNRIPRHENCVVVWWIQWARGALGPDDRICLNVFLKHSALTELHSQFNLTNLNLRMNCFVILQTSQIGCIDGNLLPNNISTSTYNEWIFYNCWYMITSLNLQWHNKRKHRISNFLTDLSSNKTDPDILELSEDPELILTSSMIEGSEALWNTAEWYNWKKMMVL